VAMGYMGHDDRVWCLNALTGKELWHYDYQATARMKNEPGSGAYNGPHAAPTISQHRIYTLSRDGRVNCLNTDKGELLWTRDLAADQQAKPPECGFAGSPLVLGDAVIVSVGSAGTALDAKTGKTIWDSGAEMAGYASPTLIADAAGIGHLLFFGAKTLVCVNPIDGKQQWAFPWPTKWGVNVAEPIGIDDGVFISSAYDQGCALVELSTGKLLWQNKLLGTQASPLLLHEGAVYGFSNYIDSSMKGMTLICMDGAKGTEYWRRRGMGGQMILADGKLVMLLADGELVIANATTRDYVELARARVQEPEECPVPPALANGHLYCRTGKGVLRCFDVSPLPTRKE